MIVNNYMPADHVKTSAYGMEWLLFETAFFYFAVCNMYGINHLINHKL